MAEYFAVQVDDHGIYLVGDFSNDIDAQVFMDANSIPGNPVEASVYRADTFQTGENLVSAKQAKLRELAIETVVHYQLVDPLIDNFDAVYTTSVMCQHLTPVGLDLVAVNVAAAGAAVTINAFVDINDVINYDVVNDPAWP